ncbi:MAG: hypothetical protein DMG49_05740 [Acidobacteria bacterium]|nr:MAG: hypothetical protein DMG49_05740 [Acidobacteriota bacterium]
MSKHLISTISTAALISVLAFLPALRGQTGPPTSVDDIKVDTWNSRPLHKPAYAGIKPATAPRRDLSGIWDATGDAAGGAAPGVQNTGAHEYPAVLPGNNNPPGGEPDESKIPRHLPYSSLGEATLKAHKPTGMGVRSVPAVLGNDPLNVCDPPGFPRMELYEFAILQIVQNADQVMLLNQFFRTWRTIWTDGRGLPKNPEPRFYGYSVGKWLDDYTFVVETVGLDERTWIDNAGRPHSSELRVEERFHRVDHDNMELTVTINDPKMYTEPWMALNKFPLRLQPRSFDIREMYCVPSETAQYNQDIGDPSVAPESK